MSSAIDEAQEWHDAERHAERFAGQGSACWCCCVVCDPDYRETDNPHWWSAHAELEALRQAASGG